MYEKQQRNRKRNIKQNDRVALVFPAWCGQRNRQISESQIRREEPANISLSYIGSVSPVLEPLYKRQKLQFYNADCEDAGGRHGNGRCPGGLQQGSPRIVKGDNREVEMDTREVSKAGDALI